MGEIKDGDDPICPTNDYLMSPGGHRCLIPTLVWKPAHSPAGIVIGQAEYPSFGQIQIEGGSGFVPYDYLCQKNK
jgi:hypothetical protein